jgi:hypothetical protein
MMMQKSAQSIARPSELQSRCLAAAIRIGERISSRAIWSGDSCSWPSASVGGEQLRRADPTTHLMAPSVYSGTAGVAIFLAELFALTRDDRFRVCCRGALVNAIQNIEQCPFDSDVSFYTGHLGIVYAISRYSLHTESSEFESTARALFDSMQESKKLGNGDIIGGASGGILALLGLLPHTSFPYSTQYAAFLGRHLVEQAVRHPGERWSWTTVGSQTSRDLCGFAHGASGCAAAFQELWVATNDPLFRYAAERAVAYENQFFSHENKNWLDLRSNKLQSIIDDVGTSGLARLVKEGNRPAENETSFMSAWCHGSPGIGLSRLRGYQLFEKSGLRRDAESAVECTLETLQTDNGNYSLCHGLFGNAETIVRAAEVLGAPQLSLHVEAVVRKGLALYEDSPAGWPCGTPEGRWDAGLMQGESGIGYFLLRFFDASTPSLLSPIASPHVVPPQSLSATTLDERTYREADADYWFGRTLRFVNSVYATTGGRATEIGLEKDMAAKEIADRLGRPALRETSVGRLIAFVAQPELYRWSESTSPRCRSEIYLDTLSRSVTDPHSIENATWMINTDRARLFESFAHWHAKLLPFEQYDLHFINRLMFPGAVTDSILVYETLNGFSIRELRHLPSVVLNAIALNQTNGITTEQLVQLVSSETDVLVNHELIRASVEGQLKDACAAGIVRPLDC